MLFFPDLRPEIYPKLVGRVRDVFRAAGAVVFDGKSYVGKIKLRDEMHFAHESTELVVKMYSEVVVREAVVELEAMRKDVQARRRAEKVEEEAKQRAD